MASLRPFLVVVVAVAASAVACGPLGAAQPRDGGASQEDDLVPGLPETEAAPARRSKAGKDGGGCTPEKQKALAKAAAKAYRDPFYDNDFGYLNDPCYDGGLLGSTCLWGRGARRSISEASTASGSRTRSTCVVWG